LPWHLVKKIKKNFKQQNYGMYEKLSCFNYLVVYFALLYNGYFCLQCIDTVGWQEGHPACKKTEWWGVGMVICLERGADLHMAQLMPLPLTISCFSKIQVGFTFLVPANQDSPGQKVVKRVYVTTATFPHYID